MTAHHRRLKVITFELDSVEYQAQITSWRVVNNSTDGDKVFTFATDGEFREETDDDYALELKFISDWTSAGISTYLVENDGETVAFTLDHHPDISAEHVQWTGDCVVKAPSVGGDVRTTEMTEITLQVIGKPAFARV